MFADISQAPAVQALARRLENGGVLTCAGVGQAAQPFFAVLLRKIFPCRPFVLVAPDLKTQESCQQDIETWLSLNRGSRVGGREQKSPGDPSPRPSTLDSRPLFYPPWEVFPHEGKLPHADTISDRLQTLVTLSGHSEIRNPKPEIIITCVTALLQKTFPPGDLRKRTRALHRGDKINPLDLIEWLEEQGYEPEAQVTRKGEIALRGGILDVWPPTGPWPARLEFFGDELESLRHFDPLTQISREEILTATIPPAGELGILKQIQSEGRVTRAPDPENGTRITRPSEIKNLATLLDYLPRETIFLLCEPDQLAARAEEYASQIPTSDPFFIFWEKFLADLDHHGMTRLELGGEEVTIPSPGRPATLSPHGGEKDGAKGASLFSSLDAFRPLAERAPEPLIAEARRREFFNQLHRWLRQGYAVHVFCNNDGEQQRLEEVWNEPSPRSTVPSQQSDTRGQPRTTVDGGLWTHIGSLSRGFLCDQAGLVVVTDAEIFGRYKIQRPRRLKSPHALATRSALDIDFTELEEGDLVVHLQYGIGKFLGLKNLPITARPSALSPERLPGRVAADVNRPLEEESGQECLVIGYAPANPGDEPPKLYVPVTEAHLVGKYVGAGKAHPPLNTLGGTRWRKAKEQAERAVRDVAAELLQIQAARETQPGHACKPDAPWQREFESAFIFEETPDQWRAIQETKSDMEKPKPMDRLICGDVGFGKTEVAIRAAFKAVMDGKQVAVLVPTTVLAQQHFNVFRERMADYPVRIELLSRFRTRRQQQRVVKDLANGGVDIVIGTHRLIQSDITFKDLGLVVIDEEQRFGVLHKEKFKRLRTLVDVLTLSATPIPRTLYLALTGARDMSTIQTPPHDRLPVETIVTQFDERIIRDAIQRELNRGGQVFFLHNRVMTIRTMADRLKRLLPRARIVVGHGQMDADELEEVMTKFVNGEADVLLSTTIIESGLDIPNANTIIIDRADRFGLSDLYQLRGRVGRYKHQAYAYLLLPRHVSLLTDVRKRISAIRQYSTLGSGFKIAMRDLEIRGAGNLLGAEQSGHITAVGFELYCQLLKQSVSALKGEKVKPRMEVSVKLDFLDQSMVRSQQSAATDYELLTNDSYASLPHNYVTESQHRIEIYRKLAQATDKPALEALPKELRDRFGPLPPPVELLLLVAELKILAGEKSVTAVEVKDNKLMLTRHGDFITLGGKFPRLTKKDARARLKEIKKLLLAI
ncbi:MAG TPA: transcription-repair coupling factor [Candidatus Limnocylindrales bacterium]|nr:transcription-repair coupling factor [Candidatus Limnocylindrales bacterium]